MKKNDFQFAFCLFLLFIPFFLSDTVMHIYGSFNAAHGMMMSFLKFAILATTGEMLGLRIKTGRYWAEHFGLLPRAIVWGFIGLTIKMAFVIFTRGTLAFLMYLGFDDAPAVFAGHLGFSKVLVAFSISTLMNVVYAPVMMTFHRVTDTHIEMQEGSMKIFTRPVLVGQILSGINWRAQWSFVFAKTIPFFWIPAHTITFLLPEAYQVLFAALLGIALGVILAMAARSGKT